MTLSFTADRKDLADAIARAAQGLPARPSKPVYAGMLVTMGHEDCDGLHDGSVALTASGGDMTFRSLVSASVQGEGSFILPGVMLREMSRYLSGDTVSITCEGTAAEVTAGRTRFTLPASDGKAYPMSSVAMPPNLGLLDAAVFAAAVRKVTPAAGRTEAVLDTVNLMPEGDILRLIATKRWVMGITSLGFLPSSHEFSGSRALVPSQVIDGFARMMPGDGMVTLGWSQNLVNMTAAGLQVTSTLVSGTGKDGEDLFPKWHKVLERMPQDWAAVSTPELTSAVKMAQLATTGDDNDFIGLDVRDGELIVTSAGSSGKSASTLGISGSPGELSVQLSGKYLLDGLGGCGDTVEFGSGARTVFLRSDGLNWMIQCRGG